MLWRVKRAEVAEFRNLAVPGAGILRTPNLVFAPGPSAAAGQIVTVRVERMRPDLDSEPPAGENLSAARDSFSVWRACWRYELDTVTRSQPWRLQGAGRIDRELLHNWIVLESSIHRWFGRLRSWVTL